MKIWQPVVLFAALLVGLYGTTNYGWDKDGFAQATAEAGRQREEGARKLKSGK